VIDDFAAFVAELRTHGVELIAVEMPYLAELEDDLIARNPDWDDERAAAYARLEEAADLDIIDVGGFGDWAEAGSFRDPRHLSRTGAGPFTRQLWAIPEFREAVLSGLASDG
jgi:hypothetical protein